jgi:hypothetical protein
VRSTLTLPTGGGARSAERADGDGAAHAGKHGRPGCAAYSGAGTGSGVIGRRCRYSVLRAATVWQRCIRLAN